MHTHIYIYIYIVINYFCLKYFFHDRVHSRSTRDTKLKKKKSFRLYSLSRK